jgi:NADH:ubiquinone oxidoreductase subunit 6 (subunit J)
VTNTLSTIVEILVYIAMGAVVVVLFMGLGTIGKSDKDKMRGNRLMRWRVGLQLVAIVLLAVLVFVLKKHN